VPPINDVSAAESASSAEIRTRPTSIPSFPAIALVEREGLEPSIPALWVIFEAPKAAKEQTLTRDS